MVLTGLEERHVGGKAFAFRLHVYDACGAAILVLDLELHLPHPHRRATLRQMGVNLHLVERLDSGGLNLYVRLHLQLRECGRIVQAGAAPLADGGYGQYASMYPCFHFSLPRSSTTIVPVMPRASCGVHT